MQTQWIQSKAGDLWGKDRPRREADMLRKRQTVLTKGEKKIGRKAEKEKGEKTGKAAYLTVYLTLVMTILISLCLACIEGVRSNAIRLEAECVVDIGLNSILAEYHRELLEQYNLFAIDSAYGSGYPTRDNTVQQLTHYLQKNISVNDVLLGKFLYRDFLAMQLQEVEMTGALLLTDNKGAVFRRRAAQAIQDDTGIAMLDNITEWIKTIEEYELQDWDVMEDQEAAEKKLAEYDGKKVQISEKDWKVIKTQNPIETLNTLKSKGILNSVLENPDTISKQYVIKANLLTSRMEKGLLSSGNGIMEEQTGWEELTERFFFQEYLLQYMGRYGKEKERSALAYQTEYLLYGKNNDKDNLKAAANALCFLRLAANATYLFSDQEKRTEAELMGLALATLITLPEIASLLEYIILCGWVYAESIYDVKSILAGGKIPLMKEDASWHYSLTDALLGEISTEDTEEEGLCYADYLRIFMMLTDKDTLTGRAMDMVEADIRLTEGNEEFRLDGCYDAVEVSVQINSAYGYHCELVRQKGYW